MLKGKKVLLGVCGSISAYKSAILVRLLVKAGAEVRVILTKSACDFITPLTLSVLSKNEVVSDLINQNDSWNNHVELALWADIFLIAPATANTIAKLSNGICDNLLTAAYLSCRCKVFIAPAMDDDMWKHPSTKKNIASLKNFGNYILPVSNGELASGLIGEGRMIEPIEILGVLEEHFNQKKKFTGKSVLVNAGPTYEAIDPVRFIGNRSSGKMGVAIANEFAKQGANVHLILGPSVIEDFESKVHVIRVESAEQMFDACKKYFSKTDVTVLSAAVADFTPVDVARQKIKKGNSKKLSIDLKPTIDVLKTLGSIKKKNQLLIGFALETENETKNAISKIRSKNLDAIVLNSLNDKGSGFGVDTNKVAIIDKNGKIQSFGLKSKTEVAVDIVNFIRKKIHA